MRIFTSNFSVTLTFLIAFMNSLLAMPTEGFSNVDENWNNDMVVTCGLTQPALSSSNNCCSVSGNPSSTYGDVEWMWARNINGDITPVTGWSTSQVQSFCPAESGYYRICSRVVGCTTVHESDDVYCEITTCGSLNGVYIYDQSTDLPSYGPIENGEQINVDVLPQNYYLATQISGNIGSITYWVNGNSITENFALFTYPSGAEDDNNWIAGLGNYNIDINGYSADDAVGEHCGQIWLTFEIVDNAGSCDNVTTSGSIGVDGTVCTNGSYTIASSSLPSGGSGALEYVWLFNPNAPEVAGHTPINSNTSSLNITPTESGYYRRCSRRSNCTNYPGESNWVFVEVISCCIDDIVTDLQPEINVSCGDAFPSPNFTNGTVTNYEEYPATQACTIDLSSHPSYDWRNFWFHSFPTIYDKNFVWDEGYMVVNPDSTVEIFGTVYNNTLTSSGFNIHYYFEQLENYSTWIAGGGYNSTDAEAPLRYYAQVDFTKPNSIVGFGEFENSDLQIVSTGDVAFMDLGPRDVYGGYGVGYWIDYSGTVNSYPAGNSLTMTAANHNDMYASLSGCTVEPTNPCTERIIREWTVEDNCGIQQVFIQNVLIDSDIAPLIISTPEDLTLNCDDFIPQQEPDFSDTCGALEIEMEETTSILNCGSQILRSWTATNECGLSISTNQTITVLDNEAPVGLQLSNYTLQCEDDLPLDEPLFSDNCDDSLTVVFEELFVDLVCGHEYVRSWYATDNCGNASEVISQIITIIDEIDPEFVSTPDDLVIENINDLPAPADVLATDNCGSVTIQFVQTTTGDDCDATVLRTWTAIDACQNEISFTQTITILDSISPVAISVPADLDLMCEEIPVEEPVFEDNCDEILDIEFTQTIVDNGGVSVITNTWIATDDNDNSTTVSQTISVTTPNAPILLNVPADITVECDSIPAMVIVTASHDCEDIEVIFDEVTTSGCNYTITRTWSATDAIGNTVSQTQVITVVDTVAPILSDEPVNFTIECIEELPTAPILTASDDCNDVIVILEEDLMTDGCGEGVRRIWTASDACGNETQYIQSIFVIDTTVPEFNDLPQDLEVLCGNVPGAPEMIALDNCDPDVSVTLSQTGYNGTDCSGTLIRMWTATDNCGNQTFHTQTITIFDDVAPVASNVPSDILVGCGEEVPSDSPSFEDNCNNDLVITFDEVQDSNGDDTIITRNWAATDACGNTTSVSQTITVSGSEPLDLLGVPANETVECNEIPEPAEVTASNDGEVNFEENSEGICPKIITRIWSATNACGNSVSATQVITVVDTTAPVLSDEPSDFTIECLEDLTAAPVLTATDNCSDVTILFEEDLTTDKCGEGIRRTWTAIDECGNETVYLQSIFVNDITAPEFIDLPTDLEVLCGNVPAPAEMEAIDNCNLDVNITLSQSGYNGTDCSGTLLRIWIATDHCGNSVSHTQTITIYDDIAPVASNTPSDLQVGCGEEVPNDAPSFLDNCDEDLVVAFDEVQVSNGDDTMITRTWTATDACGNTTSVSQTITVSGSEPLSLLGVPGNETVECNEIPLMAEVTASNGSEVSFEELSEGSCPQIITRTWSAINVCGNFAIATQVITVEDTSAPEFADLPVDIIVSCGNVPPLDPIDASDNCDNDVNVTISQFGYNGSDCSGVLTRVWTATNDCGNSTSHTQIISIIDEVAPTFVGNANDTTAECMETPVLPVITAIDNCGEATIEYFEVVSDGCPYEITRTWIATDECGNTNDLVQVITVIDTMLPNLEGLPADTTVECSDDLPAVANVTANDECSGDLPVQFQESINGNVVTRTWITTDACGNTAQGVQSITIVDTNGPIASNIPLDLDLMCEDVPPLEEPTFEDLCDDQLDVDYAQVIMTNGLVTTITNTWVATDDSGNSTSVTQTITLNSVGEPTLMGVPSDITVECSEIPLPAVVTAEHECEDLGVEFLEVTIGGCDGTITRTWTAIDSSGNSVSATQVITLVDTTAPQFVNLPEDITVLCGNIPTPASIEATDFCDTDVDIMMSQFGYNGTDCSGVLNRVWTAIDDCGNATSHTQLVTIIDDISPIATFVPEDIIIGCGEIIPNDEPSFSDNCDNDLQIDLDETQVQVGDDLIITRIWTATDACSNAVSVGQTITVSGSEVIDLLGVPNNTTVECDAIPEPANVTASNGDQVELLETIVGDCPMVITRIWSIIDACGNEIVGSQTITVEDTVAPVFESLIADIEVLCGNIPSVNGIIASDNCDEEVMITLSQFGYDGTDCSGVLTRVWTATDNCGNSTSHTQLITIFDNVAPTFVGEANDIEVECDAIPVPAQIEAQDNCGDVILEFFEVVSDGCPYEISRNWIATDMCGNTNELTQTITVNDTTIPELTNVPADVTIECADNVPSPAEVGAFDNCSGSLPAIFDEVINGNIIIRTWTAIDACGNMASATQTITVMDSGMPVLLNVPEDVIVECDDIPEPGMVTAEDGCSDVTVTFSEEIISGNPYFIIYTWTATDENGNIAEDSQVITVQDTTAPVLEGVPTNVTVGCDEIPEMPIVNGSDNCDEDVEISISEETNFDNCPYTLTRTWTATDDSGNSSSASQVITIVDNGIPELVDFEGAIEVQCDETENIFITATDNCDPDVEISILEDQLFSGACYGTIQRTYLIEDNCGNSTTAVQFLFLNDDEDPVFTSTPPTEITIECGDPIPDPEPAFATDNCDADVEIEVSIHISNDGICPYVVTYVYIANDDCGNDAKFVQIINVNPGVIGGDDEAMITSYPNPFGTTTTVAFAIPTNDEVLLTVTNSIGQEITSTVLKNVQATALHKFEFNTRSWESGVYFVKLFYDGKFTTHKLMKIN